MCFWHISLRQNPMLENLGVDLIYVDKNLSYRCNKVDFISNIEFIQKYFQMNFTEHRSFFHFHEL